jgi:hypothetical protein
MLVFVDVSRAMNLLKVQKVEGERELKSENLFTDFKIEIADLKF